MTRKEQILNGMVLREEIGEGPDGTPVLFRELDLWDRLAAGEAAKRGEDSYDDREWWARIILATVFDPETGEPMFDETDLPALRKSSKAKLSRLAGPGMRLSEVQVSDLKSVDTAADGGQLDTEGGPARPDGEAGSGG
jgi:hypothetical protein